MKKLRITGFVILLVLAAVFSMIDSGYKITQIRNGLIATTGTVSDFDWSPEQTPSQFLRETAPPPPEFTEAVRQALGRLPNNASTWDRALALARHVSQKPRQSGGGGIKSSTIDAYRIIVTEGRGYCADYTQVMNGLTYAAGLPSREWGMSFDDYSGNGHAFNEVYDPALSQWVLIDSYYSLYFIARDTGKPLSALGLRERLEAGAGTDTIEVRPILPERFSFPSESRALEYYRKGADHFFLYLGNNVFSYDANAVVSSLTPYSRALEETAGIVLGILPRIQLLLTETNRSSIGRLSLRRNIFLSLAAILVILLGVFVYQIRGLR